MKDMKKIPYIVVSICLLMFLLPILHFFVMATTVYVTYSGDAPHLYSVAVNSVFGTKGYKSNGEVGFD